MNRFFAHVDGYPQIAQVLKEPNQTKNIGGGWHTDHTYDTAPAMGSMLHAIETPPHGGDTLYASTCRAYETLSDGFKKTLEGLNAPPQAVTFSVHKRAMYGRAKIPQGASAIMKRRHKIQPIRW